LFLELSRKLRIWALSLFIRLGNYNINGSNGGIELDWHRFLTFVNPKTPNFELIYHFEGLHTMQEIYLIILIAVVAFLYASVGHGGASGYLALMVLFGISPQLMKPSALLLNIFVSGISFYMYYRKGHFKWQLLLPFIILSIPMAFVGASITIEKHTYEIILAICLIIATLRLVGVFGKASFTELKEIKFVPAMLIGAVLGFVSGMIGIGGGILLSPILLLLKWADLKQTAAVSAAFILLNSISGMAGATMTRQVINPEMYLWVAAAVSGGLLGAYLGSSRFNTVVLRYILSVVLLFASTKILLG
jgi:uncharacterized protein